MATLGARGVYSDATHGLFYFMIMGLISTPFPSNPRIWAVISARGALLALSAHSGFAAHPQTIFLRFAPNPTERA